MTLNSKERPTYVFSRGKAIQVEIYLIIKPAALLERDEYKAKKKKSLFACMTLTLLLDGD